MELVQLPEIENDIEQCLVLWILLTTLLSCVNKKLLQTAVTYLTNDKNRTLVLARDADGGSKAAIWKEIPKRAAIVIRLRNLDNAGTSVASGNRATPQSSGYFVTKDLQPTPPLEKPEAPGLSIGINNSEIDCIAKKQVGNEQVSI